MNIFLNPFRGPSRTGGEWFSVGLASSFPDIGLHVDETESEPQPQLCGNHGANTKPGCKVFHVPKTDSSQRIEVQVPADDTVQDLTDQVLVFQFRDKFHAIDHVRSPLPVIIILIIYFLY
jgi:hypothetical protein